MAIRRNQKALLCRTFLAIAAMTGHPALGQTVVGFQPFGSYANGGVDQISLADLGVHIEIPLFEHRGRGSKMGVNLRLVYDSSYSVGTNPITDMGWRVVGGTAVTGAVIVHQDSSEFVSETCEPGVTPCTAGYYTYTYSFAFTDSTGYTHPFNNGNGATSVRCVGQSPQGCTNVPLTASGSASDGSGYAFAVTSASPIPTSVVVTAPSGDVYSWLFGVNSTTDSNGNTGPTVPGAAYWVPLSQTITDDTNISATITGGAYNSSDSTQWKSRAPLEIQYYDTSGNPQTIKMNYSLEPVTLSCAEGPTYSTTVGLVTSVAYPDGSNYQFSYQQGGQLASMQLPTGGIIAYNVGSLCAVNYSQVGLPASLTRSTLDGTITYSQTATAASGSEYPTTSTITISKPDGSSEKVSNVYVSTYDGDAAGTVNTNYETAHSWYSPSGTLLKSTMKCYNGATGDCTATAISLPITQIMTTTTIGSVSSKTVEHLNAAGLTTELDEYDFGASSATRTTTTTYALLGNGIADRPSSVTVSNTSGTASNVTYGYDEYSLSGLSLVPTSGLPGHSSVTGSRGNKTSQHSWLLSSNTSLDSHWQYDDAGQVRASEDPRLNSTSYTYDQSTDSCLNSTTYPTPSSGVSIATSQVCDPNTGLVASATDANSMKTTYSYNSMLRPAGSTVTNGKTVAAMTAINYSSPSLPETITTTVTATPSASEVSTITLDGLGRTSQTVAPSGATVTTTYDSLGRVYQVSNPYYSTGDATYGLTTYYYDAVGRPVAQGNPDGTFLQWCYDNLASTLPSGLTAKCSGRLGSVASGTWVNFSDENGNQWQRTSDGLGRLTQVVEPSGGSPSPTLTTRYSYDLNDNLWSVTQSGVAATDTPRNRSFSYDSLSRLLCASNPETSSAACPTTATSTYTPGTTGYSYDGDGNVISKTDTRGISTNYSYDSLNRLLSKTYTIGGAPMGTPASCFFYDSGATNGIGRLTSEWTQAGSCASSPAGTTPFTLRSILAYDPMGRIASEQQCTPGNCTTSSGPQLWYGYDLAGNPTCLINSAGSSASNLTQTPCLGTTVGTPSGLQLITGFDSAAHMNSVTSNWTALPTPLYTLPAGGYGPVGPLNWTLGPSLSVTQSYTNRLWVSGITAKGQVP